MPVVDYAGTQHQFPDDFSQEDIGKALQFWDQKNSQPAAGQPPKTVNPGQYRSVFSGKPIPDPDKPSGFFERHPIAASAFKSSAEIGPMPLDLIGSGEALINPGIRTAGKLIRGIAGDPKIQRAAVKMLPKGKEGLEVLDLIKGEEPEPFKPGQLKNVPKYGGSTAPESGPSRPPARARQADYGVPAAEPADTVPDPGKFKTKPKIKAEIKYGGPAKTEPAYGKSLPRRNTYLERAREGAAKAEGDVAPKVETAASAGKGTKTDFSSHTERMSDQRKQFFSLLDDRGLDKNTVRAGIKKLYGGRGYSDLTYAERGRLQEYIDTNGRMPDRPL